VIHTIHPLATAPSMSHWKNVHVKYNFNGNPVEEDLYLTVDLDGHQVVVLPTANYLLASQPGKTCNYGTLREEAITKFLSLGLSAAV
jgi:hypothetical protein